MYFLRKNNKITSLILLAILFAYMAHLQDSFMHKASVLMCKVGGDSFLHPFTLFINWIENPVEYAMGIITLL
jgi:hypothetical protein